MKVSQIFLSILLVSFQFKAMACTDEYNQFIDNISSIKNKRLLVYDDMMTVQEEFENLEILLKNQACEKDTLKKADLELLNLKNKRIQTLESYKKMNIHEEAEIRLGQELDFLKGNIKNFQYPKGPSVFTRNLPNNPIEVIRREDKKPVVPEERIIEVLKPEYQVKPDKFTRLLGDASNPNCTEVINQNDAVNLSNVRDQDTVGWCYAYTASDLLSYRLKKVISAVSLYDSKQAIEKDIATDDGKGGYIDECITNYLKNNNGLCLEKDLPSSDFSFCTHTRYVDFLRSLLTQTQYSFSQGSMDDLFCLNRNIGIAFPGLGIDRVRALANIYGKNQLIEKLFKEQCSKLEFKDYKVQPQNFYSTRFNNETLINKINEQINKGEIAGIAYKYNVVSPERTGEHASIVVGRRFNKSTNKCEFLVRNSWGKTCNQKEDSSLTCHKNCDQNGCRYSGHFWLAEDRLKSAISGVTILP